MTRHWIADPRCHLVAILVVFAALAGAVQVHCADLLSSDGECYLRIARYYAQGDLRHAIFGHWSPLGAWLSVPLVAAGMAPRHAMRLWIGIWGALVVVGVWRLAGRFEMAKWLRAAATGCAALMVAEFSAGHRVDLLLTALLLFYLDAAMDERLLKTRWRALAVGLLGGLAFLAKQYALPFFAVHFTLTVLLRGWAGRGEEKSGGDEQDGTGPLWHRMMRAWVMGVGACALVAAPWVGVLSAKYGRLTLGTSGASTYQQYGPDRAGQGRQPPVGLRRPPPDAYSVWHDATLDATDPTAKTPSPFASREAFVKHLRFVWWNLGVIAGHLASADEFRLALAALVLTPIAFALTRRRRGAAFRHAAAGLAVVVFCGGYALVFAGVQRYYWFVFLVLAVLAFHFAEVLPGALRRVPERRRRLLAAALGVAVAVSFASHPVRALGLLLAGPPPGRQHRLVAERLTELGVRGPLACIGETGWWDGMHTAYYLDTKYAGTPKATTPAGVAAEMRQAGATTLLVWGGQGLSSFLWPCRDLDPLAAIQEADVRGLGESILVVRLVNRPRRGGER